MAILGKRDRFLRMVHCRECVRAFPRRGGSSSLPALIIPLESGPPSTINAHRFRSCEHTSASPERRPGQSPELSTERRRWSPPPRGFEIDKARPRKSPNGKLLVNRQRRLFDVFRPNECWSEYCQSYSRAPPGVCPIRHGNGYLGDSGMKSSV